MLAGVVVAGLIGVGLWAIFSREPAPALPPQYELLRLTGDSGMTASPAIANDGRLLAYSSDRGGSTNLDIWVQQIPGGEPIQRTHDEADDHQATFSPDGSQIAFRSERGGGGIYITAALGGNERLLAEDGRHPQFSPDGQWIAYSVGDFQVPSSVYLVPAAGGNRRASRQIWRGRSLRAGLLTATTCCSWEAPRRPSIAWKDSWSPSTSGSRRSQEEPPFRPDFPKP